MTDYNQESLNKDLSRKKRILFVDWFPRPAYVLIGAIIVVFLQLAFVWKSFLTTTEAKDTKNKISNLNAQLKSQSALLTEITKLEQRESKLQEMIKGFENDKTQLENETNRLTQQRDDSRKQLEIADLDKKSIEKENRILKENNSSIESGIREQKDEKNRLVAEIKSYETTKDQLEQSITRKQKDLSDQEAKLITESSKLDIRQQEVKDKEFEYDSLDRKYKNLISEYERLAKVQETSAIDAQKTIDKLALETVKATDSIRKAQSDLEKMSVEGSQQIAKLVNGVTTNLESTTQQLENKLAEITAGQVATKRNQDETNKSLAILKSTIDETESRIKSANESATKLETRIKALNIGSSGTLGNSPSAALVATPNIPEPQNSL